MGQVSILCVGKGDTKLVFDKDKPDENIRAARVLKNMIRSGFVIVAEVADGKGGTTQARVYDFVEGTYEYVVEDDMSVENVAATEAKPVQTAAPKGRKGRRKISATGTNAVAVGPTAGG